jgi:hypothetical protein
VQATIDNICHHQGLLFLQAATNDLKTDWSTVGKSGVIYVLCSVRVRSYVDKSGHNYIPRALFHQPRSVAYGQQMGRQELRWHGIPKGTRLPGNPKD